jgi:hypothetical protein
MEFDAGKLAQSPLARFSWARAATTWADQAGPLVRDALKKEAPVGKGDRAGRLRGAIRYERATSLGEGLVTLRFDAHVPYTPYVLDGTRPHLITAKAARALHWQDGGRDVFARRVNHPGTKANPFNERAVFPLTGVLRELFQAAVLEAMEGL